MMNRIKLREGLRPLLLSLLTAIAGFSCTAHAPSGAGPSAEISVDQRNAGSTVSVKRGDRLAVTLAGTPSTGFIWELLSGAGSVLTPQGEPRFTPGGSVPGAGGLYRFSFTAAAKGKVHLKFAYRRPFEAGVAPAATFEVTVEVSQ